MLSLVRGKHQKTVPLKGPWLLVQENAVYTTKVTFCTAQQHLAHLGTISAYGKLIPRTQLLFSDRNPVSFHLEFCHPDSQDWDGADMAVLFQFWCYRI